MTMIHYKRQAIDVKYESELVGFLNHPTHQILLVKGTYHSQKIGVVFTSLIKHVDSFIIRTGVLSNLDQIMRAVYPKLDHDWAKSGRHNIARCNIDINSDKSRAGNIPFNHDPRPRVYIPIQSVLDDKNKYVKLINEISIIVQSNSAAKIILVTTNEYAIKSWDIENEVDVILTILPDDQITKVVMGE